MKTPLAKTCIIYLRQSMDRTGDRNAVRRQLDDLQTLCARKGLRVLRVIEDNDTSASTRKKRAGYVELLQAMADREAPIIVGWAVDRLMRSLVDLEELIDAVEEHDITVITMAGDLDLSTPQGRLAARILASVARAEVEQKSARHKAANRQRAADGKPHPGGVRTPGYDAGLTAVREDEAALIREGFSALLAGSSLRSIVRDWNAAGFKTGRGGEWTPANVRALIRNPRYAGLSAYRVRQGSGEVMAQGQWDALIPEDTWTAAQAILADPARATNKGGRERKHLLSGLAVCDGCGALTQSGKHARGYALYRCSATPGHLQRKAADIDAYVRGEIVKGLRKGDIGALQTGPAVNVSALRDEAAALRVRLDELVDMQLEGTIDRRQLERGSAKAQARLAAIGEALAAAGGASVLTPLLSAVDPGQAYLDLPLDKERTVIAALVSIRLVAPGMGRRSFRPDSVKLDWLG